MKTKVATFLLSALVSLETIASQTDPLESPLWESSRAKFIGDAQFIFDDRVSVEVPKFSEDPTQVPITINASHFSGQIEKIVTWADLNPIQHIFTYYPHPDIVPRVSLRIKVQQGTAVRAAVLTKDGMWHVGGSYLDAAGGGCTTPSTGNGNSYWEKHLGETKSRFFPREEGGRYKFKVIHPMDTGLVSSIPEFYIEQVIVKSDAGNDLAKMDLYQPVSENPVITFDVRDKKQKYSVWMRDNGANEFETALKGL